MPPNPKCPSCGTAMWLIRTVNAPHPSADQPYRADPARRPAIVSSGDGHSRLRAFVAMQCGSGSPQCGQPLAKT
jgi:hypothetical protein